MSELIAEKRVRALNKNRKRRNWRRLVSVLGCIVVFCTVYALVLPAVTKSDTAYCGLEEHSHVDACYERQLTCALDESEDVVNEGHSHSDACYERTVVCNKEEHEHEKSCFSDKSADVETAEDWEATLPDADKLKGVWAEDVLTVAESQLGYTESAKNYVVDEATGLNRGYTRYGEWYGDPYGDWCAMFASFCLNYAGVPTEKMPQDANCQNWIKTLSGEEFDMYYPAGRYAQGNEEPFEPLPGDLVFSISRQRDSQVPSLFRRKS